MQTTAPKNKSERFSSSGAAANKQLFLKGRAGWRQNPSVKFRWNFVKQHPPPHDSELFFVPWPAPESLAGDHASPCAWNREFSQILRL